MEANPATEIGEVLERIKDLQRVKCEMDERQRRLVRLVDEVERVERVKEGEEKCRTAEVLLESLEGLQDRWDALLMIVEVQGQRVSLDRIKICFVVGFSLFGSRVLF